MKTLFVRGLNFVSNRGKTGSKSSLGGKLSNGQIDQIKQKTNPLVYLHTGFGNFIIFPVLLWQQQQRIHKKEMLSELNNKNDKFVGGIISETWCTVWTSLMKSWGKRPALLVGTGSEISTDRWMQWFGNIDRFRGSDVKGRESVGWEKR